MRTTLATFLLAIAAAFALSTQAATISGGPEPLPPAPPVAPVSAQPLCYPSTVGGTGSTYVIGLGADGGYIGWWCPKGDTFVTVALVSLPGFTVKHPPFNPDVLMLARAYWDANVRDLTPSPERDALGRLVHTALLEVRPVVPVWVVAKNGDKLTRPSFVVTNGKRSFSSKTTVAVGTPCDMSIKFVEGAVTFGGVGSSLVAVCSKSP